MTRAGSGAGASPRAGRSWPRFATRLVVAQALVLVAGALTTWLVASVVGPGIFHDHLEQAGVAHSASETEHVEDAFASALLISIALALVVSVLAALAVSWYFSRRVQRSIGNVADAAAQIADGRYGARVRDPGLGGEFSMLATSYNRLATRLEATETTRRRMLADLAHELRTPLATVEAHLEAVEDGVRSFDADTLAVIGSATRRMRRLAEDVAAVSTAEEGSLQIEKRPVAAVGLARVAADGVRDRFDAQGVRLQLELADAGRIEVDPERIGQVLANLLDNALRHTPAGGTVTLSCRRIESWVELQVADTGEGVAAEHLPHLFDRFYRADAARDRARGGSGIGLAIARALVEGHGGGIFAASAGAGRGTTFTVRLPGTER